MTDYYPGNSAEPQQTSTSVNKGNWSTPDKPKATSSSPTAKGHKPTQTLDGVPLASKGQRLGAYWIDWVTIFAAPLVIFRIVFEDAMGFTAQPINIVWGLAILVLYGGLSGAAGGWNFQSPGKRAMGIQAVRPLRFAREGRVTGQTLAAPGAARGALRMALHLFDPFNIVGMLSVAYSPYHRTMADAITKTVHVQLAGADHSALPEAPSGAVDLT